MWLPKFLPAETGPTLGFHIDVAAEGPPQLVRLPLACLILEAP